MCQNVTINDGKEGLKAFAEKRHPNWNKWYPLKYFSILFTNFLKYLIFFLLSFKIHTKKIYLFLIRIWFDNRNDLVFLRDQLYAPLLNNLFPKLI